MRFPGKIIVDATGQRVVIADSGHHRLLVTDMSGQKATVIGSGQAGRQDGSLSQASFHDPQGMVLNGDTLYVADTAEQARKESLLEQSQGKHDRL